MRQSRFSTCLASISGGLPSRTKAALASGFVVVAAGAADRLLVGAEVVSERARVLEREPLPRATHVDLGVVEAGALDVRPLGTRVLVAQYAGVQGDGTLEGNEEALVTYSDNLYIDQLRNAVRSAGKMSEQRVPFSVRAEAMAGLRDWWAGRIDTCFFNQIAGYTPQADTRYTGNQATIAPSSGNILVQGQSAESSLTSSDTFVLGLIDSAVTLFPEPDSPTIASVSPGLTSNDTPSTARTVPRSPRNSVTRPRTLRSGSVNQYPIFFFMS